MKQIELGLQIEAEHRRDRGKLRRDDPWFGRFEVATADGTVTVRVGTKAEPTHRIVDWREPAASALYEGKVGEAVQLELDGAAVEGRLAQRARLSPSGGVIQRVEPAESRPAQPNARAPAASDRPVAPVAGDGLPNVLSLLTEAQYQMITATRDRPVLVQGEAGSGKTTAALYRVSWLSFPRSGPAPVDPSRVLIVMFNRALMSYVRSLLAPLGLERARIDTFHGWALEAVRAACGAKVEIWNEAHEGRAAAARVKRNPGMLEAATAFVERQRKRLFEWLEQRLEPYGALDVLDDLEAATGPIVPRLRRILASTRVTRDAAEGGDAERLEQVTRILERGIHRMTQYPAELLALLSDRALLQEHLHGVPPWDIDSCARMQRTVQGVAKDGAIGPGISFEDLALVMRLILLKNGGLVDAHRPEHIERFEHLVVDEAQDFGIVELDALFRTVRHPGDVTIVGDLNQKIVPDAEFVGWKHVAKRLGVEEAAVMRLEVGHRSTARIIDLARSVIGQPPLGAGRPGPRPELRHLDPADRTAAIAEWIERRLQEQPGAHLCVVCRQREEARALSDALASALPAVGVRWGHNRSFEFAPGVTVSNVRQLKGLEFDGVLLVDPDERAFPADAETPRLLYTVITRARSAFHVVCTAPPCAALQRAVDAGLLQVRESASVQEVTFGPEDDSPF